MTTPLCILFAEDSSDDAQLIMLQLEQDGLDAKFQRVDSEAAFTAALDSTPDLILSDYSMPQFDGLPALRLLKKRGLDIPFILISGTLGEEIAVNAIKQGTDDYLLKDRLGRLSSAIQQALEQKRLRLNKESVAEALRESEVRYRTIFRTAPVSIGMDDFSEIYMTNVMARFQHGWGWNRNTGRFGSPLRGTKVDGQDVDFFARLLFMLMDGKIIKISDYY